MKLLQEKLAKYDAPQRAMAMGIYPYFREIQSDQDTEVLISGKIGVEVCPISQPMLRKPSNA